MFASLWRKVERFKKLHLTWCVHSLNIFPISLGYHLQQEMQLSYLSQGARPCLGKHANSQAKNLTPDLGSSLLSKSRPNPKHCPLKRIFKIIYLRNKSYHGFISRTGVKEGESGNIMDFKSYAISLNILQYHGHKEYNKTQMFKNSNHQISTCQEEEAQAPGFVLLPLMWPPCPC